MIGGGGSVGIPSPAAFPGNRQRSGDLLRR
jgi:hypothetical protein